jgi:DNA-binding transcriptional ArsR family regulator
MSKRLSEAVVALRALADESRARIVLALRSRPLCVCQIVEMTGLANSTVSEHLSILKTAGLVVGSKNGRWVYYRLAEKHANPAVLEIVNCLVRELEGDRQVRADGRRLAVILRIDPTELCGRQKSSGGKCCES